MIKKIVDKDLRDLMEKDGMTRFKFYIAFSTGMYI